MLKLVVALCFLPGVAMAQMEKLVFIRCTTAAGKDLSINLFLDSRFDMALHCVLFADLAPAPKCAPDGGWGLVDAEKPGVIAGVSLDRAEAEAARVPSFWARLSDDEFLAAASEGPGLPMEEGIAGETFWRLALTLSSGQGQIDTRQGSVTMTCHKM